MEMAGTVWKWFEIARNCGGGWNGLKLLEMARNYWGGLEMVEIAGPGSTWLDMAGHGWTQLYVAVNGLEMAVNGCKLP